MMKAKTIAALAALLVVAIAAQADTYRYQESGSGPGQMHDGRNYQALTYHGYFYGQTAMQVYDDVDSVQISKVMIRIDSLTNTSTIPAGATITAVTCSLYCYSTGSGGGAQNVNIYEVLEDWDWNGNQDSTTNTYHLWPNWVDAMSYGDGGWTNPGPSPPTSAGNTKLCDTDVDMTAPGWLVWELNSTGIAVVQDWYDGTETNRGFVLSSDNASSAGYVNGTFYSSQYDTDSTLRPVFSVDYTTGGEPTPTGQVIIIGWREILESYADHQAFDRMNYRGAIPSKP